ncbi:polysaccharide biosynthesis tyrosine autokinase [Flagellimonas sp. CMM7]|uniref:GumC family protein n=1 Tax=Flagellimonas sp. CMM7 TaxID=2654676 RepID=UPI0013D410C8|nr:polysaccharide biosynthesis tyrosine autokinase [Flagellimonas sp. CMM7]UII79898.1 polysaccharide biosynthesis tyrosine autokinase [Flagellimonas sp. CMM7]
MDLIKNSENETSLDLKNLIGNYLRYWKWFALCLIIALALAYVHLRYSIPEYSASAKIQMIEDKNSNSELSIFKDLNVFSGSKTKIEDEIEILNSRANFIQVIKDLGINIRYTVQGNIKDNEIYGETYPFNINFLATDSIIHKSKYRFFVELNTESSFGFSEEENQPTKPQSFGSAVNTQVGDIILIPNSEKIKRFMGKKIRIEINPINDVAQGYRKKMKIAPASEFSNIINITLTDPIQQKAIDIINRLILINNNNSITDKKEVADRTSKFINDRISKIYTNLSDVDDSAESFKTSKGIADLGSQSSVNFNLSAAGEQELEEASIQLDIASSMQNLISSQEEYDLIPANIGLSNQGVSDAAVRYNELVAQRNRLLASSNEKNPVIVKLDQQLESLKRGMQTSLNNVTNNLNLKVNSLGKQLSQINSRIYAVPSNERALRDITRKQQTTESLYLYLLQKREESQIAFASAESKSKVVDSAHSTNRFPVSPKPKIVYLGAFLLGLLIPFSLIYLSSLLDNKIHNKLDLEKIVQEIPVIAELPKLGRKESKMVLNVDRSVLAESMRILRTNLDYILKSKSKEIGQTIFVTSSVPGEGKTFVSSNLALIFANTNKKVLLIGADIRNPKLYTFFPDIANEEENERPQRNAGNGLTEYLYDHSLKVQDIINRISIDSNNIDVIYSGKIPPNPSELLMSERLKVLFEDVVGLYDYVIVDTAPLMVVTDTLLINQYANQILYITKAGVTDKKVLQYPLNLKKEGRLKGLSFIVNNVKEANLGYGGKYGYGYGKTVKKWWKFS